MDKKRQQQAYENYVKQKTPVHNLPANMTKAFVTGGAICVLGQGILNICEKAGLDKDIVLLCYERPTDFCHRHLVSAWFREHGIECKEYEFGVEKWNK